jgi:hypothetical protein
MTEQDPDEVLKSNIAQGNERSTDTDWRTQGNLIVLATFDNAPEAHCLRIELENNGIRSEVTNETSAQTVGASLFGRISAVWIEVVVLDSDAAAALKIKNDFLSNVSESESEIPEWVCDCGETVDAGFAQCWSCMSPFPDLG